LKAILSEMEATGLLDANGVERVQPLLAEGRFLDEALVSSGAISEEQALKFLGKKFGVPYLDLSDAELKKEFLQKFPVRVLLKHRLLWFWSPHPGSLIHRAWMSCGLPRGWITAWRWRLQ
jgi:hypothetical protein